MRIGILGGTFDPPHVGHLQLARCAREQLELDEVMLIPAKRNPLKRHGPTIGGRHRMAMLRLLTANEPGLAVSDIEVNRSGPSFAIETIENLQMIRPAEYWWILGSDAALQLDSWKNIDKLMKMCRFAVALRRPHGRDEILRVLRPEVRDAIDFLELPPVPASSTTIRNELGENREPGQWVPEPVLQYIRDHGLYGEG